MRTIQLQNYQDIEILNKWKLYLKKMSLKPKLFIKTVCSPVSVLWFYEILNFGHTMIGFREFSEIVIFFLVCLIIINY